MSAGVMAHAPRRTDVTGSALVRLLGRLAEAYPDRGFGATADRWRGYVDRAGAACPAR